MSLPANDDNNESLSFKGRVLLFQFNREAVQTSDISTSSNGSSTILTNPPQAVDDADNENAQGKEYSLLRHDAGSSSFLNASRDVNNGVLIPIPDWSTALKEWGLWWDIHVYGIAALFLALACVSVAIFVRFRDRVLRFQIVLNTLVLLTTSGLFRAIFLLVDAYGHQYRMTPYMVGIMTQAVYPLLCACFGLTQVMLVKVTNVDVGPKKFRSLSSLLGCTLGYLFLIVVIESIVYLEPHLKLLLLLDSGCFIVWSLYLTVTFICNGFRLSQYTSETKKARKELNAFSIQRRSAGNATNTLSTISNSSNDACFSSIPAESSDVTPTPQPTFTDVSEETTSASFPSSSSCSFSNYAQHNKPSTMRLSRPKMKIADHNHMTIAMITDDDDQSTSSTDVEQSNPPQKVHKICTRHQKKWSSRSRTKAQYKTKHDAAIERLVGTTKEKESCDKHYCSIATDDTPDPVRSKRKPGELKKSQLSEIGSQCVDDIDQRRLQHAFQNVNNNDIISVDVNSSSPGHSPNDNAQNMNQMGFHADKPLSNDIIPERDAIPHGCDGPASGYFSYKEPENEITSLDADNNVCSSVKENGYLADTENTVMFKSSPKTNRHRLRTSGNYPQCDVSDGESSDSKRKHSDSDNDNDVTIPPSALSDRISRNAPAIMSLFRIRQSKMVQRAVHLTYLLTFLFVFASLMQLYTVFGVYGVLGKIRRPHPWPWLIFHTIFRILECSMGFTCAAIAFITLNHRHQRAKRRLQQQQQQHQQHHQSKQIYNNHQRHHSSEQALEQHTSLMNTRECVV